MIKLILLALFFIHIEAYDLQENYLFEHQVIYSNDLFPELPQKFELLRIPDGTTHYRINAQVLSKSFELHGIAIDLGTVRFVNFTQLSPIDLTLLEKQLSSALLEHYPTMIIDHIQIIPHGYIKSLPKNSKVAYEPKFFQSAKGTFYIPDEQGIRYYFDYSVTATINVLHTAQKVERKEVLSDSNVESKRIPFSMFNDSPLTVPPSKQYRFRTSFKAGTLLTERNIEEVPLVLRGQKVTVVIQSDSVSVEFDATATQEGALYDMITIQKNDGKRVKAKVIGENRVELL
ncbi:flagellar basal body P-ring formation chaperone FlgA [Sulfuricurvum sp.]|uniref:flagellar basal body P-ring formation chaperone FlgA n=1 Tax=Sulfuricurvum sp. TaxID=2025608 RepID=UPI0035696830